MKLNGIELVGYFRDGERVCFEVSATLAQVAALDVADLAVTDDGTAVETFSGYSIDLIEPSSGGTVRVWCRREMDQAVKKAIEAVEQSVLALASDVDEAKQAAAEAGTDPAVAAAAKMFVASSASMTSSEVGSVLDLIADFEPGAEYAKGQVRRHDGKYWRMAQKIDSTTSKIYQPGTGTESLYTLIDLAADGIRVWHPVTGATDSFALDERCHYPDADGPIYVSKRDGNDNEPGTDEWWDLAGDDE